MRTAVVVGAGIGGLAVAGALARTGWQVTLIERADRLRPGRSALVLSADGVRALGAAGLAGGLDAVVSPLPAGGLRRFDGQWLIQPVAPEHPPAGVVVHEADLHDALVAGLGDRVDIRLGMTAAPQPGTAPQPGAERPTVLIAPTPVTLPGTSGRLPGRVPGAGQVSGAAARMLAADLVVVADGAHSAMRSVIAPDSVATSAGYAAWRAVIPWYRAPQLSGDVGAAGESIGGSYRFRYASLGERGSAGASSRGGVYWVATAPGAPRPEPPAAQLTLLRRWFAGWHEPVGQLLAATEPEDLVTDPVTVLRPLPRRFTAASGTGGYLLLGDAAHAMEHHLAQGAGLALEDAVTVAALMRDAVPGRPLLAALDAYTRTRRPRALRLARQSHRYGLLLATRGRVAVRARDAALGAVPTRLLHRATGDSAGRPRWRPPD